MTDTASQPATFPLLELVAFVDSVTAVLVGPGSDKIELNDELYVLGHGFSVIPKVNVPLVAPKARLVVTFPAGPYVLAKTPFQQTDSLTTFAKRFAGELGTSVRPALTNSEHLFLGDPGREPVKVGDTVIRVVDLGAYIKWKASTAPVRIDT